MNKLDNSQVHICEQCGKEFQISIDGINSKRFCCLQCKKSFISKKLSLTIKKRIDNGTFKCGFNTYQQKHRNKVYDWKCVWCEKHFTTRRELYNHKHFEHIDKCKLGWNKGQTKETNKSILQGSITYLKNLELGKVKPNWLGKHHSLETRDKMSKIKTELYKNGLLPTKRIDVKYYSISNLEGKSFKVQGTWELHVAEKLNSLGILWNRNKYIKYKKDDGSIHRYIPDFYLPLENSYVEVKGFYGNLDKEKMKLVLSQNEIKLYFIGKDNYSNFLQNKIELKDLQMVAID